MIGNHILQRPGALIKRPPPFNAHGFSGGDLYRVDVAGIPEGLEDTIAEPGDHDVPDCLLAQEMVDPIDLAFAHVGVNFGVERLGRRDVVAERLFDHHATKAAGGLREQAGFSQALNDDVEEAGRHGEVEDHRSRAEGFQPRGQGFIRRLVLHIRLLVENARRQTTPRGFVDRGEAELTVLVGGDVVEKVPQSLSQGCVVAVDAIHAQDAEVLT